MATPSLNKELYLNVSRLKSLNSTTTNPKFLLEQSPFDDDDDDDSESIASASPKEVLIIGRIFPDSEIFRDGSFKIEMKLPANFPFDPPEVRFLTKIYHPNVAEDGRFCHGLLKKHCHWTNMVSLVDVVKAVVEHVDNPDIDFALSTQIAMEYMKNRPEFNRKALEFMNKYALPRN